MTPNEETRANLDEFKDHTIKEIRPGQFVCARPDGSWTYRFFVAEIGEPGERPQGLAIAGDICPKTHGVISSTGKGFLWFSGDLSRDYLCEKFLEKEWVPEEAMDHLRFMLKEYATGGEYLEPEETRPVKDAIRAGLYYSSPCSTAQCFYEWYEDMFGDGADAIGYGYNRQDADILVAIHATFRRLYHGMGK